MAVPIGCGKGFEFDQLSIRKKRGFDVNVGPITNQVTATCVWDETGNHWDVEPSMCMKCN